MLDTYGIPDPDLLIRTCNEQRISNFFFGSLRIRSFILHRFLAGFFQKTKIDEAIEAYNKRDRKVWLGKKMIRRKDNIFFTRLLSSIVLVIVCLVTLLRGGYLTGGRTFAHISGRLPRTVQGVVNLNMDAEEKRA